MASSADKKHSPTLPEGPAVQTGEARAKSVIFAGAYFTVILNDDRHVTVPIAWYPRLAVATPEQQRDYEIVANGHAIHWQGVDEDIRVSDLLAGKSSAESRVHLKQWYEQQQRAVWEQQGSNDARAGTQTTRLSLVSVIIRGTLAFIVAPFLLVIEVVWRMQKKGTIVSSVADWVRGNRH